MCIRDSQHPLLDGRHIAGGQVDLAQAYLFPGGLPGHLLEQVDLPPVPTPHQSGHHVGQLLSLIHIWSISSISRRSSRRYAEYDRRELRREIELIDPTVIVCGYTISALNIIMETPVKEYANAEQQNSNLFYTVQINGHAAIVLDLSLIHI